MHANPLPSPADLPLRDRLAQLIFVRIGSNLPPIRRVEDDQERILQLLASCPVGGILLFNGGEGTKRSLRQLQQASRVPLLVAADVERGVGQQVRGYTTFPHPMAFANQEENVEPFVDVVAREARDAGIHVSFSPVADVSTNPQNPIISIRAYSEDPQRAARLTAAYVAAAESRGLLSTAKHFPGHGDTHQDSHDSLPVVRRTLDDLRACELLPFQAAIVAGASLVMTAHVSFPEIDPSGVPATLSPVILKKVLRDELGFRGAVCSDSLLMAGVRERFATEGEMALAALNAGVDLLLDIAEPAAVVDFLAAGVESRALDPARVDEALARLWHLKARVSGEQRDDRPLPSRESREQLAYAIARQAVTTIGEQDEALLPFDPQLPLTAILLKPFELSSDPPEQPLADALRQRFHDVKYLQLGPRADAAQFAAAARLARQRPQLLVAMIVKPAAWHAFGLLPAQREFVEQLTRDRDTVLVSLGVPYALQDYPSAKIRICTYSDVPVSQQAVAEFVAQAFQPDT